MCVIEETVYHDATGERQDARNVTLECDEARQQGKHCPVRKFTRKYVTLKDMGINQAVFPTRDEICSIIAEYEKLSTTARNSELPITTTPSHRALPKKPVSGHNGLHKRNKDTPVLKATADSNGHTVYSGYFGDFTMETWVEQPESSKTYAEKHGEVQASEATKTEPSPRQKPVLHQAKSTLVTKPHDDHDEPGYNKSVPTVLEALGIEDHVFNAGVEAEPIFTRDIKENHLETSMNQTRIDDRPKILTDVEAPMPALYGLSMALPLFPTDYNYWVPRLFNEPDLRNTVAEEDCFKIDTQVYVLSDMRSGTQGAEVHPSFDIESPEDSAPSESLPNKYITPEACLTKIHRQLVSLQALEEAREPFEEALDSVIVLRALAKEDMKKLMDRTKEIRRLEEREATAMLHEAKAVRQSEEESPESIFTEEDSESVISSYAPSVFSVESLVSAGTHFSRNSGFTVDEITTATRRLIKIFQEDTALKSLYIHAIKDPAIGSVRLERNMRRLLKQFAHDLEKEAKDRLEYLGARLVSYQAKSLAKAIVSRFDDDHPIMACRVQEDESDDSSDDDEQTQTFDDTIFEDLAEFTDFLIQSQAYQQLLESVERFALRKASPDSTQKCATATAASPDESLTPGPKLGSTDLQPLDEYESSDRRESEPLQKGLPEKEFSYMDTGFSYINSVAEYSEVKLVCQRSRTDSIEHNANSALALERFGVKEETDVPQALSKSLEPPPTLLKVQLKWQCRCSRTFSCELAELRQDGVLYLIEKLQQSTGSKVTVNQVQYTSGGQAKSSYQQLRSQLRNAFLSIARTFKRKSSPTTLPQHNSTPTVTSSSPQPNNASPQILHLLACMHAGRFGKTLRQDRIDTIISDRSLFSFMHESFTRHCGMKRFLAFRAVRGIFFVKFRLPLGGSLEVRHHDPCCEFSCSCIPPKDRVEPSPQAEYRCIPGPPPVWPPVDPGYLAHLFNSPSCASEHDTWILDQLPKRICGELRGKAGRPADGWGIYYQEDWDLEAIIITTFVVFIIASILFAVLWSYFRMDVQGAFGVSAYMGTACSIFVSLIAVRAGKS